MIRAVSGREIKNHIIVPYCFEEISLVLLYRRNIVGALIFNYKPGIFHLGLQGVGRYNHAL